MKVYSQKAFVFLYLFLLAAGIFLCLKTALDFDFINLDDPIYVTENPHVITGLNSENISWAFTTHHGGHWHPVTWLSYQFDCHGFGAQARALHRTNIVFHILNACLVFLILFKLFDSSFLAFLFSLLFAIHPLRLESVVWISERKDVLSLFFGLCAFLSYLYYCQRKSLCRYLAMLLCFCLSLLAKPTFVSFPFLLLLLDFWPLKNFQTQAHKKIVLEKTPLFLVSLLFSVLAFKMQDQSKGLQLMESISLLEKSGIPFVHFWLYFWKTVWPFDLSIFYPWQNYSTLILYCALVSFLFLSLIFSKLRLRYPFLFFGWSWFFISLLPVLGFVQIGGQSIANRWTYLPHVGLAIAFCGALKNFSKTPSKILYTFLIVLICFFVVRTQAEIIYWKESETLFKHALKINPSNFLAHNNLGTSLDKKGRLEEAEKHYKASLEAHPSYAEALNNLGQIKAKNKNFSEALSFFKQTLQIDPNSPEAQYNLALTYYYLGDKQKAFEGWLTTLYIHPFYSPALQSLRFMSRQERELPCQWGNLETQNLLHALSKQVENEGSLTYWEECIGKNLSNISR